ncbi:hypothetical protein LEP1GSC040_0990 [Leptospira santarosai str. 2000030832]|nr:hypothetical protein LEP1GSC040_0990 [Leptospira santarosai str. 2000030832]
MKAFTCHRGLFSKFITLDDIAARTFRKKCQFVLTSASFPTRKDPVQCPLAPVLP